MKIKIIEYSRINKIKNLVDEKNFGWTKKFCRQKKNFVVPKKKLIQKKSCSKNFRGCWKNFGIPKKVLVVVEIFVGVPGVPNFVPGDPRKPGYMRVN